MSLVHQRPANAMPTEVLCDRQAVDKGPAAGHENRPGRCIADQEMDKAGDVAGHLGAANVVKHYAPAGAGGHKQLLAQLASWRRRLGRADNRKSTIGNRKSRA